MLNLKNKKVTVLGAQRSGLAVAKLVMNKGGVPRISERKRQNELDEEIKHQLDQLNMDAEFGGHTKAFVEASDLIVLSPGVMLNAPAVQWAKVKNIPVLGEVEFAAQFCKKPIIAVTGSNGKTTVSSLIYELLKEANYSACLCGNVGFPFCDYIYELDHIDYVVLEVSSFQLESLLERESKFRNRSSNGSMSFVGFKPFIAILLNFSQNHLDRHKDLDEYFKAKTRIFLNQDRNDYALLNRRDQRLSDLMIDMKAQSVYFNEEGSGDRTFSQNPNNLAVLKVAEILDINEEVCKKVIKGFKGVEHRLEWVRTLAGVDYINDSKATTAEASQWALRNIEGPIVMICGGRDKNIDYSVLTGQIQSKVKKMFVIGEAQQKIKKTFDHVVGVEVCEGLDRAVEKARQAAQRGDHVIFSPMCASFDMFLNFEERGQVYKRLVNQLK